MPSLLPYLLLLPSAIAAASLDCKRIRAGGQDFNLEKLGGPKTVHDVRWESPSVQNTTFTIDICNPLTRDKGAKKGEDCPLGTRVCAKEWDSKPDDPDAAPYLKEVVTIAGEFKASNGRSLDPKYTRLKDSVGNSEEKEGVVVELHGGKYPDTRSGTKQKAVVEFLCDRDWEGTEGFGEKEEGKSMVLGLGRMGAKREEAAGDGEGDEEDAPELPDLDEGKALQFVRYEMDTDNAVKVLRLRWKTRLACEGASDEPSKGEPGASQGWGFFTWLIIILFLLAAAYIIFGSWLNYNRYGARGWDLIPHGDTIRDIPYIVKDWSSGVAERLRGDGRGGYSAV